MQIAVNAFLFFIVISLAGHHVRADFVVDFEELTQFTGDNPAGGGQFYNGNDGTGSNTNGWVSGDVFFNNSYTDGGTFDFWSGWAYSNVVNSGIAGFTNQYASWPGGGSNGAGGINAGENYAIAFGAGAYFNLPINVRLTSVELANSTYAGLSMLNGDAFAKQFGGPTSNDPDFFRVILTGFDDLDGLNGTGQAIGSVTVDLADYTFADNSQDYILEDWLEVDLSTISNARSVALEFESSDVGQFGINTPTYIALDNLRLTAIPEPHSFAIIGLGVMGCLLRRHNRRAI